MHQLHRIYRHHHRRYPPHHIDHLHRYPEVLRACQGGLRGSLFQLSQRIHRHRHRCQNCRRFHHHRCRQIRSDRVGKRRRRRALHRRRRLHRPHYSSSLHQCRSAYWMNPEDHCHRYSHRRRSNRRRHHHHLHCLRHRRCQCRFAHSDRGGNRHRYPRRHHHRRRYP